MHWTDKICLALPKISTKFVSAKFSICQSWAHWETANYLLTTKCQSHGNRTSSVACCSRERLHVVSNLFDRICCLGILLLVFLFFSSFNSFNSNSSVACTCNRRVCIRMCIWSVYVGMYKLNSTWTWRCNWNVNVGTIIVVFWVMIVMQHPEVRIFHLHRLIAAQIWNNFGGLQTERLSLKVEIKFS